MDILLAVDGGGTKTEVMLVSVSGEVLAVKKYEGTNINSVGMTNAVLTLEKALADCLDIADKHDLRFAGIHFGLAGGVNGNNQEMIYNYFKNGYFQNIPFSNAGDDLNSINVGVKNASNGIAVIAGTGSNVMIKKNGVVLPNPQLSGWGYLFDNGASGFDFGRDAVVAAKNECNGTGEPTKITKMLEAKFGCKVFDALGEIYEKGPRFVASLGPIVFDAYRDGDKVAGEIIDAQVRNVENMINRGHEIIGADKPVVVGLVGGIFAHEIPIFTDKLGSRLPQNVALNFPKESQIYGAVMEAAKNAGVKTDSEFLRKYHSTVDSPVLQSGTDGYVK
ncbi:MAG: ROK family protein [Clostridia bacterium]|nr:ROK family protein [Clostridia bacterium]